MDRKDYGQGIPDFESGRLSAEERARLYEENGYSHAERKKMRAESERLTKSARAKNTAAKKVNEGSRNDRVKSSTKQRKRESKRQNRILVVLLFVVALVVTALVSVFVFRINEVEIINPSDLYANESVMKYADIDSGDSMLLVNSKKIQKNIEKSLPYIETAVIKRKWPDKIIITVEYATPAMAVDTGSGYIILSSSCKVLEKDSPVMRSPAALLKGVSLSYAENGEKAEFTGKINTEELIRLSTALEENGFTDITLFDLTLLSDVVLVIGDRVEVRLGTLTGATEKFAFGKEVIARTAEKDTKHQMVIDLSTENEAYVREKYNSNVEYGDVTTDISETSTEEALTENKTEASDGGNLVG